MKKRVTSILLALLLLAGCAPAGPVGDRAEFDAFCGEVNSARRENQTWTQAEREAVQAWEAASPDDAGGLTDGEIRSLLAEGEETYVDRRQARADVELFFRLLKEAYGGYEDLGGDAAFLPARDAVLERVEAGRNIGPGKLSNWLSEALAPIVRDGHFSIRKHSMKDDWAQYMYYVPGLYFDDLTDLDMDYVKPTIGPSGAITHCFAALSHDGADLPVRAVVAGEERTLEWVRSKNYAFKDMSDFTGCRRLERGGLTVLETRTMYAAATETSEAELESMAHSGAEYRGLDILIVDVRGNGGGSDAYCSDWLEGFTGQYPQLKVAAVQKCNDFFFESCFQAEQSERSRLWLEELKRIHERGETLSKLNDGLWQENPTVIFVLTDKNCASAGEGFVLRLRTLENVIQVGGNTAGSIRFGNVCSARLPATGLRVQFGTNISASETLENREGVGYLPDLWVNPADALDAVERLVKYYGLDAPSIK